MILRILFFLALLPQRVLGAQGIQWQSHWDKFREPVAGIGISPGKQFLNELANGWFNFIANLVMGISIIAVIWGASTMQGVAIDEGRKENGKKIIIGALIGLVLAILARSLVHFADQFVDANNFPVCGGSSGPGCP